MKYKYIIPVILILLLLYACGGAGSYTRTLSGGYSYHEGGENYHDILDRKDVRKMNDASLFIYLKKNIYSKVIDYSFNGNFIVAVQSPNKHWCKRAIVFELEDLYSSNESEVVADSIIKNDPYYHEIFAREVNYWIISHRQDSLFGPYSEEEYLQKRKELGVPEELKLDSEKQIL